MDTTEMYLDYLAEVFDKPLHFVKKCVELHDVSLPLPRFRHADDGLGPFFSDMSSHYNTEPSMTKQEFTDECDINVIMRRFLASDFDPSVIPLTRSKPMYGDFTSVPESYHAALNYVIDTENMFLTLPAELRYRFDNDPQKFLNFYDDPANAAELVELGLKPRTPESSGPLSQSRAVGTDDSPAAAAAQESFSSSSKAKKGGKEGD
nr:MAG: internal scaffolding protein [Microvirus sp.]